MKIAIFTDDFLFPPQGGLGGVEQHILAISQELLARGHEVKVFAPGGGNPDLEEKFHVVPFRAWPLPSLWPGFGFAFPIHLYFHLKKWRPDVIHWQTPGPVGLTAIFLAKVLKTRLVGTFHGYFGSPEYLNSSQPWLTRFPFLTKFLSRLLWRFAAFIYSRCQVVVAPTQFVVEDLRRHRIKAPLVAIPTVVSLKDFEQGVPPGRVDRVRQQWQIKGSVILYVGRVSPEKSLSVLLVAVKEINLQQPTLGVELLLVGDGKARPELEKLSQDLAIAAQVKFVGRVAHADLSQSGFYEASDLFVIPSTSETMSIVALEAMTKGLPVVVPVNTAIAELVSGNGLLFEAGNEKDLAGKIFEILSNEETKKRMSLASRQRAQEYTLERTAEKLEKVYRGEDHQGWS